jgi:hypothetical protein
MVWVEERVNQPASAPGHDQSSGRTQWLRTPFRGPIGDGTGIDKEICSHVSTGTRPSSWTAGTRGDALRGQMLMMAMWKGRDRVWRRKGRLVHSLVCG